MNRPRYLLVATVAALIIIATSCARQPEPAETGETPSPVGGRTVTVERTGGIAGVHDTAVIEPTGGWTRTSRRGGQRSGRLTAAQQRELSRLIDDPRLSDEVRQPRVETRCRDAFAYRVMIDSMTISYVDCPGNPDSPEAAMAIVAFVESATNG